MEDLIVLGLIPGTTIQIDFVNWLIITEVLLGCLILNVVHRRHLVRKFVNVHPFHHKHPDQPAK